MSNTGILKIKYLHSGFARKVLGPYPHSIKNIAKCFKSNIKRLEWINQGLNSLSCILRISGVIEWFIVRTLKRTAREKGFTVTMGSGRMKLGAYMGCFKKEDGGIDEDKVREKFSETREYLEDSEEVDVHQENREFEYTVSLPSDKTMRVFCSWPEKEDPYS